MILQVQEQRHNVRSLLRIAVIAVIRRVAPVAQHPPPPPVRRDRMYPHFPVNHLPP